jgi:hypothetical protein
VDSANDGRSILHLTLEREWFNDIVRGVKNEEYRDLKNYWKTRLEGRTYDIVRFRNGYATDAPVMDVEFLGVDKRKDCYAIRLGKILRIKGWLLRQVWIIDDTFVTEPSVGGIQRGELPGFDLTGYEVVARYSKKEFDAMMRAYRRKHGHWPD